VIVAAALVVAPTAEASPVRSIIQPLGILSDASKPNCASPTAPYDEADFRAEGESDDDLGPGTVSDATYAQFGSAVLSVELLPSVTVCSPTFASLPGPFGGSVAGVDKTSRVGIGWREMGGTLASPAPLVPGDTVTVPEVDDAAELRVSIAKDVDQPAVTAHLSDLAPGPSTVAVSRDARGFVATLTRADGSTAESVVQPPVPPKLAPHVSGRPRQWKITTQQLAGTVLLAFASDDDSESGPALTQATATGPTSVSLKLDRKNRGRHGTVFLISANREAQTTKFYACRIGLTRKRSPYGVRCVPYSFLDLFGGEVSSSVNFAIKHVSGPRPVVSRAQARTAFQAALHRFERAAAPHRANVGFRRRPLTATAAAAAPAAPITVAITARAKRAIDANLTNLRPLASDINGDHQTDYWTDNLPESSSWLPLTGGTAGFVLVSSPEGLEPPRVDVPTLARDETSDSEISAIDDVTGDGVGELVVDLGERHGLIPGSRSWTSSTFPITAPDPADLAGDERVLALSGSSVGAPYGTLDDVNGDGLHELAATDDSGAWFSASGADIVRGALTRLPSVTRRAPVPASVRDVISWETTAPQVSPGTRIIGDQAIALGWPKLASTTTPTGTVQINVRNANGLDVRPAIQVSTPGNAVLLDYDRLSGDALLLAVAPNCLGSFRAATRGCLETVLRVAADGRVKQTIAINPYDPGKGAIAVGTSRFLTDGPDADSDADVVAATYRNDLALISSATAGVIDPASVPQKQLPRPGGRVYYYAPQLRLFPVVAPDGTRRVNLALTSTTAAGPYGDYPTTAIPGEVVWK
jgi:hypothetical protein